MNQFQVSTPGASQRARIAIIGLMTLFGVLTIAFFRLQVLESNTYQLRSDSNRLRPFPIEAPRGAVFDRNGRVVASSVPGYSLHVFPSATSGLMETTLERLQSYLDLDDARIELLLERSRREPYQPLLVEGDADFDLVSTLEEHRAELPGVVVRMDPKRQYQAARAVSHLMGYVGEVTADELEREQYADYSQGMTVGKEGVERQYEARLQGKRGLRYSEVDALGRVINSPFGQVVEAPEPGVDIHLNLDLDLMEWIHHIFPDSMRGAVVALDVEDGGVLALYSAPTFDPNSFVGGIEPEQWASLNSDPEQPLFNRAVVGRYAPGSTWKLAVAAIGLQLGLVEANEYMPRGCSGAMFVGNRMYRCWNEAGHGALDLVGAIQHSCNVYFYQLGLRIGLERLLASANDMGFARQCGIDLPRESPGVFPGGLGFWEERFGYRALETEVLSLAIGQGPNDQTPLGIAQFYLAMARGGRAPAPRILRGEEVSDTWDIGISPEHGEVLKEGLRRVFMPGGTAFSSRVEHWELMGKSGTAQNAQDPDRSHAWFAAMAGPRDSAPEIVVVVLVELGESGSIVAAPLAAKSADYFLRKRHGIPTDTIQTLGEHLLTGTPAPWANW
jgi:penicillin-binding protein 2